MNIDRKVSKSVIFNGLNKFTKFIYEAFARGIFGRIMTSYQKIDGVYRKSAIAGLLDNPDADKRNSSTAERGVLSRLSVYIKERLLTADFSTYAVFVLVYCVSMLVATAMKDYFSDNFVLLEMLKLTAIVFVVIMAVLIVVPK